MLFKSITRNLSILTATGLLSAGLAFSEPSVSKQIELEKEGIQLIAQLEDISRSVHYNADRLDSLSKGPRVSNWSNAHHLMEIKDLVNKGLRPALARLTEIQSELKDWHQDVIDQMLVSAKALAADTNAVIIAHNDKQAMPPSLNQEYKDLIARINTHAETLVKTSDAAGDYASAHEQALQAGLQIPAH